MRSTSRSTHVRFLQLTSTYTFSLLCKFCTHTYCADLLLRHTCSNTRMKEFGMLQKSVCNAKREKKETMMGVELPKPQCSIIIATKPLIEWAFYSFIHKEWGMIGHMCAIGHWKRVQMHLPQQPFSCLHLLATNLTLYLSTTSIDVTFNLWTACMA